MSQICAAGSRRGRASALIIPIYSRAEQDNPAQISPACPSDFTPRFIFGFFSFSFFFYFLFFWVTQQLMCRFQKFQKQHKKPLSVPSYEGFRVGEEICCFF